MGRRFTVIPKCASESSFPRSSMQAADRGTLRCEADRKPGAGSRSRIDFRLVITCGDIPRCALAADERRRLMVAKKDHDEVAIRVATQESSQRLGVYDIAST